MNVLLRQMMRYYGIGEAELVGDLVEENDLRYRWIRRAVPQAESVVERQIEAALRQARGASDGGS